MPVREAVPDDLGEIATLIRELAAYEGLEHEVMWEEDQLREHLFGPEPVARVSLSLVEPAGGVAGFALWFPTFSTFLGQPGIWLEDLFVRSAYRRQGHGRALLTHLRSLTSGRVEWAVLDWNQPAIDIYEAIGARPVTNWIRYRWGPAPDAGPAPPAGTP